MNEHARTVLVDMDGVIADFDGRVRSIMADEHPHIELVEPQQNFYVADDYPEHRELVRAVSRRQGFFESLPVMPGAFDGWQRLLDLGYHPQICTSPIVTNLTCESEKLGWLAKHFAPVFGDWVVDEAVVTSTKHLQDGIALIDDRPGLHLADQATWQYVVFDQPYNQHYHQGTEHLRLRGWYDRELPAILDRARQLYLGIGGTASGYIQEDV